MTSFQQKSAISRKEYEETPYKNLGDIPRIQIPPIPMPPLNPLPRTMPNFHPTQLQHPSQSLSPNILLPHHHNPTPLKIHSQSLSPTLPTPNRDRKRFREDSADENKDAKRRKLSTEAAVSITSPSHGVPPPSALMFDNNRPPSISTDNNDNPDPLNPMPLNSAGSNCSSISRTSPSISSEPNLTQTQSISTINTNDNTANDNNKEIHLVLQNLASLVAKNNHNNDHNKHNGAPLTSLLSTPEGLSKFSQLLPTQQTQTQSQSMSNSPNNNNNNNNNNNTTSYNTLGLRIPNIDINSINNNNNNHTSSLHPMSGSLHCSTDRINQFIFGGTLPVHCKEQNGYNNCAVNGTINAHGPVPQPLQTPLQSPLVTMNDIDSELQKEMNKREMRKIISHQLENLRQQILQQEREDEAKLQALKFMKLMQSSQINQKNKLPINYSPNSNIQNQHFTPTLAPLAPQQQQHPLPLPQFLQIPQFNSSNVPQPQQQASYNNKAMYLDRQKTIISDNKTRSNITPMLSGYKDNGNGDGDGDTGRLPIMSDSNEWNAVAHSNEYKQTISTHIDLGESKYPGHGRDTIIAATGKIQPRKDMDESQCALLCNLMVELCFTERLDSESCGVSINTLKIDPEICLNMNLNTNTKMNGFSSMIGHSHSDSAPKVEIKKQSGFNIVPPTFQQTSTNSNSMHMPGLEDEAIHNLSSSGSDSSSSSSASSSEDEFVDKFKSDSEDEPIEQMDDNGKEEVDHNDEDIDMNEQIFTKKEEETLIYNGMPLHHT